MFRFSRFARGAFAVLGVAALALTPAGCSKKKLNTVDAAYVPEGTPSTKAIMLLYPEAPMEADRWVDNGPQGASPDDSLLGAFQLPPLHPGAVMGAVLDSTTASSYEVFRRESNGGFHRFQDYLTHPATKWLDTQWEAYSFLDPSPSGFSPPSYMGRGVVAGTVTSSSPLTNEATLNGGLVSNIAFDFAAAKNMEGPPWPVGTTANDWGMSNCDSAYHCPDTLFAMAWDPVPGAAGYWIQIYQFTGNTNQKLESGYPQPLSLTQSRDFLVAFVPGSVSQFNMKDPGAAMILTRKTLLSGQEYELRISAVDNKGTLLAMTYGNSQRSTNGDKILDPTTVAQISGSATFAPCDGCTAKPVYVRYWTGAVRVFAKSKLAPCGSGS
jgi:hypothetical protein